MQKEQYNRNNNPWSVVRGNKKRNGRRTSSSQGNPESVYNGSKQSTSFRSYTPKFIDKPKKVPIEPVINYASIASTVTEDNKDAKEFNPDDTEYWTFPAINIKSLRRRKSVRNSIPKPNFNVSYDVWEHTYFQHILDLADIFFAGTEKLGIYVDYINFLDVFGHFIRDCSSGEISPHIEELSDHTNNFYMNFSILRNEY